MKSVKSFPKMTFILALFVTANGHADEVVFQDGFKGRLDSG